jgi:putative flavoprotein involved in K+ transport
MGFSTDYRWIEIPLFDGESYPTHTLGVTAVPDIYFLGLPWQYTWGSSRFSGVARDACFLRECVEGKLQFKEPESEYHLHEWALGC